MSISWSWSLCAVQKKNISRADNIIQTQTEVSFPSIHQKMAKMCMAIPLFHSTILFQWNIPLILIQYHQLGLFLWRLSLKRLIAWGLCMMLWLYRDDGMMSHAT